MIAVIGATGSTGSQVVKALKGRGAEFKCIVRDPDAAAQKLGDVELVKGDLADKAGLEAALEGVDTLYLVCGHSPALEELETNAVEAAEKAGISYFVYQSGSSRGIRPDSPSDILIAHYNMEEMIKKGPWKWAVSQPNYYMSNLMMMAGPVKGMGKVFSPLPADTDVTMIHTADIGESAAELILNPDKYAGGSYYLAGDPIKFSDIADAFTRVLGKQVDYVQVSPEDAKKAMTDRGLPEWLMKHLAGVGQILVKGDMAIESDNVQKLTGHAPRKIDEYIKENEAVFK